LRGLQCKGLLAVEGALPLNSLAMKPNLALLVLIASALATFKVSGDTTNTFPQPPANAVVLWNGHDLTGWKTFFTNADVDISGIWFATNGALRLSGKPYGYLHTENTFSNYHLHVEWRWPAVTNGNSGVLVHIGDTDAIWPVGVECQLRSGIAGELIGLGGVDFPAPMLTGRKRAKITTSSENPIGEWNSYDIYCQGDTIKADVNGFRKNFIDKVSVSSGGIGLQLEGAPIEFRNIWLEPL
jgi:Domain of Unknown Function (DUF1080)